MPPHASPRWARAGVVAATALLLLAVAASPAAAHSQLVSMFPADGSTVTVAPVRVVLTFDEDIQHIGDAVIVTGPDGRRVDDGAPVIQGPTASQQLKPLTVRGHYTVSYRIVSDDGHPVSRTLGFVLAVGSSPTATPAPAGGRGIGSGSGSGGSRWVVITVAVALVILLVWLFLPARRRGGAVDD